MATIREQAWVVQATIDRIPDPDMKAITAYKELRLLNERRRKLGLQGQRLLMHTFAAFHLDDGLTLDSMIAPHRKFGELVLTGALMRLTSADVGDRQRVLLEVHSPTIHGPEQEIEGAIVDLELGEDADVLPLHVQMDRPLYLPVIDVYSVWAAA